jgi:hypothetical protein
MLRYRDGHGGVFAALLRPADQVETLDYILDSHEWADRQLLRFPDRHAVVLAANRAIIVTDPEDLTLVSFWLAVAADRLKKMRAK